MDTIAANDAVKSSGPSRWANGYKGDLIVAALALIVPIGALSAGFVWDDANTIVDSPVIRDPSTILEVFRRPAMWMAGLADTNSWTYRPLALSSMAIDYQVWGMNPMGFHLTNLLLHALTMVLARRWFATGLTATSALALASACAVHTSIVESIVWVNGRSEPWALLFGLVALIGASRKHAGAVGGLVGLGVFGALLGKETGIVFAVMAPFFALTWTSTSARVPGAAELNWKRFGVAAGAAVAGTVAYFALRTGAVTTEGGTPGAHFQPETLKYVPAFYSRALATVFAPLDVGILTVSPDTQASMGKLMLKGAPAFGLWAVGAWALFKKHWTVAGGIAWWTATLGPCALIVASGWPGLNRWLYVGMPGILLALFGLAQLALARLPAEQVAGIRRLGGIAAGGLVLVWVLTLWQGVSCWQRELSLFQCTTVEDPESGFAWNGLGHELANQGRWAESIDAMNRAHQHGIDHFVLHWVLARDYVEVGDCDRAAFHSQAAVDRRPSYVNQATNQMIRECFARRTQQPD
jgi:hypothetical protein